MQIAAYIKNFLVLFVVITIILQLIPGEHLKNYILFFSQFVLVLSLVSPVLTFFWDSDVFFDQIEYEAFSEKLAETARDAERISTLQEDEYREKYEEVVAKDVFCRAQSYGEEYGCVVERTSARLNTSYEIEALCVVLKAGTRTKISIEPIQITEERVQGNEMLCQNIKEKLESYYQLEEGKVYVSYAGAD